MQNYTGFHLKKQSLMRYGLPDIPYPVSLSDLDSCMGDDGKLPLATLLHGLQQQTREGGYANLERLEPAMERLTELLTPEDTREVISAAGDCWWLEIGPVDMGAALVAIQRNDLLIAVISTREDGRLRMSVFRPLDAKSAESLIGLGQVPHPEHGVCMRENNWEYALDCSAGAGNYYAADRGEAYLSYWEKGIGVSSDGVYVPKWWKQRDLVARPAARVVTELGIHYTLSGEKNATVVIDAD